MKKFTLLLLTTLSFSVHAQFTITSFTPTNGVVGTTITITHDYVILSGYPITYFLV